MNVNFLNLYWPLFLEYRHTAMCFSEKLQVSTGYVLGEICQTAGPIIHRVTKLWFVSSTGNIFHPPLPIYMGRGWEE